MGNACVTNAEAGRHDLFADGDMQAEAHLDTELDTGINDIAVSLLTPREAAESMAQGEPTHDSCQEFPAPEEELEPAPPVAPTALSRSFTSDPHEGSLDLPKIQSDRSHRSRHHSDVTAGWPPGRPSALLDTLRGKLPAERQCFRCGIKGVDVFMDPADRQRYCEHCWVDFYGTPPWQGSNGALVEVDVIEVLYEDDLVRLWSENPLPGWPPSSDEVANSMALTPRSAQPAESQSAGQWSNITVCVRRSLVGPSAREQMHLERTLPGETLAGRYKVSHAIGEGCFTKAFLAEDTRTGNTVCLKCYNRRCCVDELVDLMVLGGRLSEVDPGMTTFPRIHDAFFDLAGFTVECLIEGPNCSAVAAANPQHFEDLTNLAHVARGALHGLALLEKAGIVHNDLKPDNIIWVEAPASGDGSPKARGTAKGTPSVRIVDFGCARLDQREDPGKNWNMAEGGAGHLGYASPEMSLGLPITHVGDVWNLGLLLCELHCGRGIWFSECLTPQEVMAQAIGLCNLEEGIPSSLLRKAPFDIRLLYTPMFTFCRGHFPVCRAPEGKVEVLRPRQMGLDQVLGADWQQAGKGPLRELLLAILQVDHVKRPSAKQLLNRCSFVQSGVPKRAPPKPNRRGKSPEKKRHQENVTEESRAADARPAVKEGQSMPPVLKLPIGSTKSNNSEETPRKGAVKISKQVSKQQSTVSTESVNTCATQVTNKKAMSKQTSTVSMASTAASVTAAEQRSGSLKGVPKQRLSSDKRRKQAA